MTLDIWEGQFGDFANGAQVVIDQFISSGEAKWDRLCGLALFLPHGYEGQGPEHSSARLERFLQLCALENMQVCVPTTPAQMFHMLRRQMRAHCRKPLVVMTPKSLLRHKLAVSSSTSWPMATSSTWSFPIRPRPTPKKVKRVVLCSGKVYYDLVEDATKRKASDVAIVRVEQLYPFPRTELKAELKRFPAATEVIWCQEEPHEPGRLVPDQAPPAGDHEQQADRCLRRAGALACTRLRPHGTPSGRAGGIGRTSAGLTDQQRLRSRMIH
jgi:2-oxoglutarate dehydrogenase E1 component